MQTHHVWIAMDTCESSQDVKTFFKHLVEVKSDPHMDLQGSTYVRGFPLTKGDQSLHSESLEAQQMPQIEDGEASRIQFPTGKG